MSDIQKCEGTDCPWKENCYRFTAVSNPHWQAYGPVPGKLVPNPVKIEGNDTLVWECDQYWPNKEKES